MIRIRIALFAAAVLSAALFLLPRSVAAQTDEIQVYDGGLAPVGVFNLTLHNNYIAKGSNTAPFPGGVKANHSFNGVSEWALGVTNWFEAGLYMPLYSHDADLGWGLNGFKLRALFAVPNADDRKFFYGANFEFSVNAARWDSNKIGSEVRPIVGWHFGKMDVIINPIVDTAYDGFSNLEFVPAERVAFNLSKVTQLAVEEYADYGPVKGFLPAGQQVHQLYGVYDRTGGAFDIEAGVGIGLNDASDRWTFKVILSRDLNHKKPSR